MGLKVGEAVGTGDGIGDGLEVGTQVKTIPRVSQQGVPSELFEIILKFVVMLRDATSAGISPQK